MDSNKVIQVNKMLYDYSEALMANWYPIHGHSYFERAVTCAEGPLRWRSYSHQRNLQPISADTLLTWSNDIDHGIFHGLMTGFIGFLYQPATFHEWLPDFLLHDIIKCSNNKQDHDTRLRDYFCFHDATYWHSDPLCRHEKTPLVVADRVELMRYCDYEEWINRSKLDKSLPWDLIDTHYQCVRPHICRLFEDRYGIWVRHYDERGRMLEMAKTNNRFIEREDDGCYPRDHWCPFEEYFAVDVGSLHNVDGRANRLLCIDPCMCRIDCNLQEDRSCGLISHKTLRNYRFKVRPSRDHFIVDARVPYEEWVFLNQPPYERWDIGCVWLKTVANLIAFAAHIETLLNFIRSVPFEIDPMEGDDNKS